MNTAERVKIKRRRHKLVYAWDICCDMLEGAIAAFVLLLLCGWI